MAQAVDGVDYHVFVAVPMNTIHCSYIYACIRIHIYIHIYVHGVVAYIDNALPAFILGNLTPNSQHQHNFQ